MSTFPLPLSLITGFLGSGKTTLLNHLLDNSNGRKIAVIENEFVLEVGIENELVSRKNHDDDLFAEIYEFGNGCKIFDLHLANKPEAADNQSKLVLFGYSLPKNDLQQSLSTLL